MKKNESLPIYLFHQGTNYRAYEFMGAHFGAENGKRGVYFRVWAPNASAVSVVGDFNEWNAERHPMRRLSEGGVYEVFIPRVKRYDKYKYAVTTKSGERLLKADPYAFHSETPPETASKVYDLDGFEWTDSAYSDERKGKNVYASPMNVYEVNLGSWKRNPDGSYYTYKQYAKELVKYVKAMGYTHVEFMPLSEYPFDGSWGYQVTGYYAITSRFGTPKDFMSLVNEFHINGIGVIMDWVPAHFPKDAHGLYEFDGKPLYENQGRDRMEHKRWGTRIFDFGRNEVQAFLISNALFLLDVFHIDGLRVDAVASMLYLDYDREPNEWIPNKYGENKNLEAIAFLQKLNTVVFGAQPNALMIAEESTAWPMITKPVDVGGLGFNFKWNMGWMNDMLAYQSTDAYFRKFEHNKLTFSMMYAFSENYILPISHDEVVHGKKSLIDKCPCAYEDKFAAQRSFMCFMMSHPGKKLLFMGCEYGQFREWNYADGLEFFMLDYPLHAALKRFTKELNEFYTDNPSLYEIEDSWDGFEWLLSDERDLNLVSFIRRARDGSEVLVFINFSGADVENFRLGVEPGKYRVVFNSDAKRFGGADKYSAHIFHTVKKPAQNKPQSIVLSAAKFSAVFLTREKTAKGE